MNIEETYIIKVQVPIMSNDPDVGCLIYTEGKNLMVEQTISNDTYKQLNGDLKGYFIGTPNMKTGLWEIGERVEDQDW